MCMCVCILSHPWHSFFYSLLLVSDDAKGEDVLVGSMRARVCTPRHTHTHMRMSKTEEAACSSYRDGVCTAQVCVAVCVCECVCAWIFV